MGDERVTERLARVDNRSKAAAVIVAFCVFAAGVWLFDDIVDRAGVVVGLQ